MSLYAPLRRICETSNTATNDRLLAQEVSKPQPGVQSPKVAISDGDCSAEVLDADDIHRSVEAAYADILAEFAAGAAYVRRYLRQSERRAALRALRERRMAALALVKRTAALELAARKQAIAARKRSRSRSSPPPEA